MIEFTSKEQVHNHACLAVGKTLGELASKMDLKLSGKKSQAGDAWESWFGVSKNSEAEADLPKAGIELKMTGVFKNSKGMTAKERLVLNIINYIDEFDKTFETSSFWKKNQYTEIGFYEYDKKTIWTEQKLLQTALFTFPEKDLLIIKQDWELIHDYIRSGRAHELSEGLTMYLAPCTKGANRNTTRFQHPSFPADTPKAKQRAYSLKSKYMTYIVREYIFGPLKDPNIRIDPFIPDEIFEPIGEYYSGESIVKDLSQLKEQTFQEYVLRKMNAFVGKSMEELAETYGIKKNAKGNFPKSIIAMSASRMLGIHGNIEKTEEFFKANINVKTIRIQANGKIKENMSFPAYKAKELVNEEWETSTLRELLDSGKFFFVVFKETARNHYVFSGVKFWTMPEEDLETTVREAWLQTVATYQQGVQLTYNTKDKRVYNNLLAKSDGKIISVRPHASKSSYIAGNPNADELPKPARWVNKPESFSDSWMTKQCFWLNNDYLLEQISDLLNAR